MELNELKSVPKARNHKSKVVGRGHGSGLGKTSGRGQKGQKARKSGHTRPGFEGGQTPLYRRLPKFGFSTVGFKNKPVNIDIAWLLKHPQATYTRADFVKFGWINNKSSDAIKLIGNTRLAGPVSIQVQKATKQAVESVTAAGGKVDIIELQSALKEYKKNLINKTK